MEQDDWNDEPKYACDQCEHYGDGPCDCPCCNEPDDIDYDILAKAENRADWYGDII